MKILSCLEPKRVYNKYRDEMVTVNCGSCPACVRMKSSIWVSRLEQEAKASKFVYFVTLTYDDLHLPLLTPDVSLDDSQIQTGIFDKTTRFVSERDGISIPFKDFVFAETKDLSYFHRAYLLYNGIPYASKDDVQKFNKRLNKYFYEKVTNKYQNFRFFLVSELGSTTFRPHFHAIYFTNDQRVANNFGKAVCQSWSRNGLSIGRTDTQFVKGSASNYVAQYLNCIFDCPSFYSDKCIKPFYLQSRRPSIGNVIYDAESLRKIFDSRTVRQIIPNPKEPTSFVDVPLQRFVENRLYPKFSYFDNVSDSLRAQLYRVVTMFTSKPYKSRVSLRVFVKNVLSSLVNVSYKPQSAFADLWSYLKLITSNCETAFDNLKRLYYISRRFLENCAIYGLSEYSYLLRIVDYYKRKECVSLRKFYEFQVSYVDGIARNADVSDLAFLYPEFAYQNSDSLPSLSDCGFHKQLAQDSLIYKVKATKTHLKNHYLDKLQNCNEPLYSLIKLYHHA